MKKLVYVTAITFFAILLCSAQNLPQAILISDWERIYIKNVGSFDLPPTMEIQKGKYREFVDEIKKIKGFDATQLTAQQKGLNEFDKKGLEKYARVMIETTVGSAGDFEKLNFNISKYTQTDISKLNSSSKEEIQKSSSSTGLKLIEWFPLKIEKINGMSSFHICYKRQLQNNPIVLVHMYIFHNNDRMHTFTLSYRLSEVDFWKSDFATILKSFRITNVK